MQLEDDNNDNIALNKYEAMLKSNRVIFFDSSEFENIIHFYLDNGKVTKAKRAISMGLSQHPASISLKLLEIEIMVFEDDLDKADILLNKLQALEPENDEIYIQKASLTSKRNNHEEAIKLLQKAFYFTEDKADVHALLGMEYLYLDDFENAKDQFSKCLALDPDDYSSLYNTINCYNFLEQSDEAISFLNGYLDINPYCEVAWHELGKQYTDKKEYERALAAYDFAIISDDTFVGAYIEKGKILEKLTRYQDAIENYLITLELEDPTSYALLHIGKCYEKLGNRELALKYYKQTVHEDPLLDKGWVTITKFYVAIKEYQKALYYINKAIQIDGENFDYWKQYGKINLRLSFLEEAERGFRKTIELGSFELQTWLDRADVLWKLGEPEAALICLDQALEIYPENSEIYYRMAGLYYATKTKDKAKYHLENALDLEPEYFLIIEELFPKVAKLVEVKKLKATTKK